MVEIKTLQRRVKGKVDFILPTLAPQVCSPKIITINSVQSSLPEILMHISLILFKQKRLYYTFKVLVFQLIYLRFLYSLLTLPHFYGSTFHCVNVQEHPCTSALVCFCKYVLTLNSQHRSCWGKTICTLSHFC